MNKQDWVRLSFGNNMSMRFQCSLAGLLPCFLAFLPRTRTFPSSAVPATTASTCSCSSSMLPPQRQPRPPPARLYVCRVRQTRRKEEDVNVNACPVVSTYPASDRLNPPKTRKINQSPDAGAAAAEVEGVGVQAAARAHPAVPYLFSVRGLGS